MTAIILTAIVAPFMFVAAVAMHEPRDENGKLIPARNRTFGGNLRNMLRDAY